MIIFFKSSVPLACLIFIDGDIHTQTHMIAYCSGIGCIGMKLMPNIFRYEMFGCCHREPWLCNVDMELIHFTCCGCFVGVLDCTFHPRQPWLFTAGADSVIRLYCH